MIRDFKFAFRQLFKTPAFTISAATVLALGIGVNTAVFSLVNTLFFAPPAYAKPHEMVQLFSQDKKDPKKFRGFSYPTYLDIREQNTVFSDVLGFNLALIGLGQKGETRRTFAGIVTSNYFSVLGVPVCPRPGIFAGGGNARTQCAGRDCQLQLLAEARPRSGPARLAGIYQRPLIHDRRHYAEGFRRHDANSVAGGLVADERLRSSRERF